jgi:hypothetical protein
LNQAQARVAYRGLKERLGEAPKAVDLKRHPRITAQEAKRAPARERAIRAAKTRALRKARPPAAPPKAPPKKAPPGKPPAAPPGKRTINTLAELEELPDYEFETVDEEDGGGVDTE